jgi:hypothetical protein
LAAALFDEHFLAHRAAPILAASGTCPPRSVRPSGLLARISRPRLAGPGGVPAERVLHRRGVKAV